MRKLEILVMASDVALWAVRPFAFLFNKYVDDRWPVTVAGFTRPEWALPSNFRFVSLGKFEDYPVERWSDALIDAAALMPDQFVLMLEDAWPIRPANTDQILRLAQYMKDRAAFGQPSDILRIDLTSDRLNAKGPEDRPAAVNFGNLDEIDLIRTMPPAQYQISTTAGIWNRDQLLRHTVPGETPWQFEIRGSQRANDSRALVLGTRQYPLRHTFAIQRGKVDLDAAWMWPPAPVQPADRHALKRMEYLPPGVE